MRTITFYNASVIRATENSITILCPKNSFPLNSELLRHENYTYRVVYVIEKTKHIEIRLENIKWR